MAGTLTATTIQNDTSSPPTFRNNSVEIGRLCRAWCQYNGSAQTVTGSFNISSVTYNGAGDYSFNFTTAMPNANYAGNISFGNTDGSTPAGNASCGTRSYSTTSFRVNFRDTTGTQNNWAAVNIAIFSS